MSKKSLYRCLLALPFVLFLVSIASSWWNDRPPIDLGLDLAGGVVVVYDPDLTSRLDTFADLGDQDLLLLAKQTIVRRLTHNLNTVPDVVIRNDNRIVVSIPKDGDYQRVLDIVGRTYHLTLRLVDSVGLEHSTNPRLFPYQNRYLELAPANLSGDMLDQRSIRVDSRASDPFQDPSPAVAFRFRPPHDKLFAQITGENVGRELAVLLDDEVQWVGTIESTITGDGILRGGYSLEQATDIATMLRSGSLPISLELESLTSVGPILGQELQHRGSLALLGSLVGLAVLVAAAYLHRGRLLLVGLITLGSLLLALVGLAALFDLTLDLVGIAGLILAVGMGMDAFLLVFEGLNRNISETQTTTRANDSARAARRIYSFAGEGRTLLHANATTLIVVLLLLSADRLRSFALFMLAGIAASLLTILVTRTLLQIRWLKLPDMGCDLLPYLRHRKLGLFRWRRLYLAVLIGCLALTVSAVALGLVDGLSIGADFQPGSQLEVTATSPGGIEGAVTSLRDTGLTVRSQALGPGINERALVTISTSPDEPLEPLHQFISETLASESVTIDSLHSIGPRISSRRMLSSASVLVLSFGFPALYFALQGTVETLVFSQKSEIPPSARLLAYCGVLVAVVADLAVVAMTLVAFEISISLPVVAAVLTIVGYSVNDSVVLWTHVQGTNSSTNGQSPLEVVTEGVDGILSRTILTSLSTMLPPAVILLSNLTALRDFALVIIAGTMAGSLSSIFIVGWFAIRALESRPKKEIVNERLAPTCPG